LPPIVVIVNPPLLAIDESDAIRRCAVAVVAVDVEPERNS
jgi:hypothetical protein